MFTAFETFKFMALFGLGGMSVTGSISQPFSFLVELKLANFLQLIGTIKRTIFKKVRTETILKLYNTLVLPTFLYGSENWTLTASRRRRIEAAEIKLLRPLAG
jgi:hypothetical protein